MKHYSDTAKGIHLDKIGEMWWMPRKRFRTIPLLFGWKLVKEESDDNYRSRILKTIKDYSEIKRR